MSHAIDLHRDAHPQRNILYFEDDEALANLTISLLEKSHYQVCWHKEFSSSILSSISNDDFQKPNLVLIDIGMPNVNGYEICKHLKEGYLPDSTPVIFTSGKSATNEILKCYEVGGDDYLEKPIRNGELLIKINKFIEYANDTQQKEVMLNDARTMVFEVMTSSSELGKILHFFEESLKVISLNELSRLLINTLNEFNLKSSVIFSSNEGELYFSSDQKEHPLEIRVFREAKNQQRIIDIGNKSIFNASVTSMLIKNMPIEDPSRYGNLKDQICLLLNCIDARVKALNTSNKNDKQNEHIKIVGNVIGKMVEDMKKNSLNLSKEFEEVIIGLEMNVSSDLLRFNLLQEEEDSLMKHINTTIKSTSKLFDKSVEFETQYGEVMKTLLQDLNTH